MACPQPVILAKKAIETNDAVTILVDNATAVENIRRMAKHTGCSADILDRNDGVIEIRLARVGGTKSAGTLQDEQPLAGPVSDAKAGPLVVAISDNRMGRGDDELGEILIRSFIHTLLELNPQPDTMIFYNAGAKLTIGDSSVIDDLQQLAEKGVEILICGTCANFFGIKDHIGVGTISNMYDIADIMARAGRLVRP